MKEAQFAGRKIQSVLIVEDHPLFSDALSLTLRVISQVETVHIATTLLDALDAAKGGSEHQVIFLDLNLPDVEGLEGLIKLRHVTDEPIVVVSSMSDPRMIAAVLEAGAQGFVPKHSPRSEFARAVAAIEAGQVYVPEEYTESAQSVSSTAMVAAQRLASLTQQQAKILELICAGKLNKQIAYDLSIAETTVKAHVTAIMRKLCVQSRTQAVLMAKETSFANLLQGEAV